MSFKFTFSGELYHIRKANGWSQQYVADQIKVSLREYQNIESGKRLPHVETFMRLVYLFELNIADYREEVMADVPVSLE